MILEIFTSGPLATNAILLGCTQRKKAAVIDAPFQGAEAIVERARDLCLDIEMLLLTHSHWDHIADVAHLKELTGAPVYVHACDAGNLIHPGQDGLPLLLPIQSVVPDHELFEGQLLSLGDLVIQVMHTPGHSPGSVCFYLEKQAILVSGDTLFQGSYGNIGFPTSQPNLMVTSLKKLANLPPSTRVYPGHGHSTTIGAEKSWLYRNTFKK